MVNSVMNNSKTIKSVDFSTNCKKRIEGNPCRYCYVETSRKVGFNAKQVHDYTNYTSRQIIGMKQETIDKLNSIGGIRLFSFGDYDIVNNKYMYSQINDFLTDCSFKGLKVKVITKQVSFIDDFLHKFWNTFSIINISIDNIGDGVPWDVALQYKKNYSTKVKIRSVILNDDDIAILNPISDILTFNHGLNGYKNYKETPPTLQHKTCCNTGKCITCNLKCGAICN